MAFSSETKIVKNVVRGYELGMEVGENTNTTIAGNDSIGNRFGVIVDGTTGTKMLSNDISRYGDTGISIFGQKSANVKVVGNNISGGTAGIYVADTKGGSFAANTVHDNCAGMFFEADGSKEPVSDFEVKGNTVKNNTRSC